MTIASVCCLVCCRDSLRHHLGRHFHLGSGRGQWDCDSAHIPHRQRDTGDILPHLQVHTPHALALKLNTNLTPNTVLT